MRKFRLAPDVRIVLWHCGTLHEMTLKERRSLNILYTAETVDPTEHIADLASYRILFGFVFPFVFCKAWHDSATGFAMLIAVSATTLEHR